MPAAKRKPKPRKREAKTKRTRGSQKQLNLATTRAIVDLQKRVKRLERKDRRRMIGFHAEGTETYTPDLEEIAETEIIG